jgi:hypothetical protein
MAARRSARAWWIGEESRRFTSLGGEHLRLREHRPGLREHEILIGGVWWPGLMR